MAQWASALVVPANYLSHLLFPGSPPLLDGPVFCVPDVRWPRSPSQWRWYLVDPLGSHLAHKTQTSAGILVGQQQTSERRRDEERGRWTQSSPSEGVNHTLGDGGLY